MKTTIPSSWIGTETASQWHESLIRGFDFEFIMAFTTTYRVLSIMEGVTTKLQSTSLDVYDAYFMASMCYYMPIPTTYR